MQVLVTGAAGFLGSYIVGALLARGDSVVALDHRLNGKALTASALARVQPIEADILEADAVERAARGCAAIFHCAAIVGVDAYVDRPTQTMETEVFGLRNVCAAARAQESANPIVITCSSSAVYGHAGGAQPLDETMEVAPVSTYGIAKGALIQMTRMLAIEWAEHDIRVNAVAPGRLETRSPSRAARTDDPAYMRAMLARIPLHRLATVDEVAAAVCYLASPQAGSITGQTLVLDGGITVA